MPRNSLGVLVVPHTEDVLYGPAKAQDKGLEQGLRPFQALARERFLQQGRGPDIRGAGRNERGGDRRWGLVVGRGRPEQLLRRNASSDSEGPAQLLLEVHQSEQVTHPAARYDIRVLPPRKRLGRETDLPLATKLDAPEGRFPRFIDRLNDLLLIDAKCGGNGRTRRGSNGPTWCGCGHPPPRRTR